MFSVSSFAALALLIIAPAAAQEAPPIVVQAPSSADLHQRARQFVEQVSQPVSGQLPRFNDPICPGVIGLSPAATSVAVNRMRAVAGDVGVAVADQATCKADVMLILVADGRDLIRSLRTTHSPWLNGVPDQEVDAMLRDAAPVHHWSPVVLVNEDNQPAIGNPAGGAAVMRVMSASTMHAVTKPGLMAAGVVIDAAAATGMSIEQIADYALIRALTYSRGASAARVPTILTLFDRSLSSPPGATAADRAYVRALYTGSGLNNAGADQTRIADAVAASLV